LYNLNKKGTIVVGHMRSGSHYLANLVKDSLDKNNTPHTDNDEYFKDSITARYTHSRYTFSNIVDKFKQQAASKFYSVGTIVYPGCLDMISQHSGNYQYFMDNYHVIKNVRKDIMAQFMSMMMFNINGDRHSGIKSIGEVAIRVPFTASETLVLDYAYRLLELERFHAHKTVYYEDLPHDPIMGYVKNHYGITPRKFFKNYDEIVDLLSQLNITQHYEW
jgi:hypothetical protein